MNSTTKDTPTEQEQNSNRAAAENPLRQPTATAWVQAVLSDFDSFLQDHAAAEKKASGMALSMISHYPDRTDLVEAMTELAIEELNHYREVIKWLHRRGKQLAPDTKDPYILAIRDQIRQGRDNYFLDRLVSSAIIEARGCERFGLIAQALPECDPMKRFYQVITASESRHYREFMTLAKHYFDAQTVEARADELLDIEASIVAGLPVRAALH